jgi:hypothetical protein
VARHAVFTIVQDDPINLRIWANHYRRTYGSTDTFVLHHPRVGEPYNADWITDIALDTAVANHNGEEFDEGFMIQAGVFREESFNHTWLRETVQAFQRFLFQSYDTVLFTEIDEIVAVDPRHADMPFWRFLDAFAASDAKYVRCTGYEVVHDFAVEPPIDYSKPLLKQRTYWYPTTEYSKPLLSKVPMTWVNGFHSRESYTPYDSKARERQEAMDTPRIDLLLLHLHKLDFGSALERHKRSAAQRWSRFDRETRQGIQNMTADEDWLRGWWLNTVDYPYRRAQWTQMPDAIKEIV